MREQFGERVHRLGGDARQHIREPSERLDPAALASCDEAQQDGRDRHGISVAREVAKTVPSPSRTCD